MMSEDAMGFKDVLLPCSTCGVLEPRVVGHTTQWYACGRCGGALIFKSDAEYFSRRDDLPHKELDMSQERKQQSRRYLGYVLVGLVIAIVWAALSRAETPSPTKAAAFEPAPVKLPFVEINIFDPLPPEIQAAPLEFRVRWIKVYNEETFRRAAMRAYAYNSRQKFDDVHVQASSYQSRSYLDQKGGGYDDPGIRARSTTSYDGTTSQRTFFADRWGGGSVVIINPYATEVTRP